MLHPGEHMSAREAAIHILEMRGAAQARAGSRHPR